MLFHIAHRSPDQLLFRLHPTCHLGDIIVSMNIIFNLSRETGKTACLRTGNPEIVQELLQIFDYEESISLTQKSKVPAAYKFSIGNFIDIGNHRTTYWCGHIRGFMSIPPFTLRNFRLPRVKIIAPKKRNYVCYQIDSYSSWSTVKPKMEFWELMSVMNKFKKEEMYFIGKPDTEKIYPEQQTHFANLIDQAEFLLGCERFFGVDSGMSHFAGTLGVNGDIVSQQFDNRYITCVEKAYRFMYPQFRLHRRKDLKKN